MPFVSCDIASQKHYEVCVVGAGPAGLAVAFSLKRSGISVLVVECGTEDPTSCSFDATGPFGQTHAPLKEVSANALGGTSWKWGGRIMPIASADFRDYEWPLAYEEYTDFLEEAACFLKGPKDNATVDSYFQDVPADLDAVEKMTAFTSVSQAYQDELKDETGPDIALSIEVTGLEIRNDDQTGRPRCVGVKARVLGQDKPIAIQARTIVLAAGGISTTRLMLAAQARDPEHLGHLSELGAYYCGHLTGSIASIEFPPTRDIGEFGWSVRPDGSFRRRVFHYSRARNCGAGMIFWAKNKPLGDASHGSAILSAKHIVSKLRTYRKETDDPDAPRIVNKRKATPMTGHVMNLLLDGPSAIGVTNKMLKARRSTSRPRMDYLVPNRTNTYRLCYHSEHALIRSNRISLSESVQPDRLPAIHIDFEFSDADIESVLEGHRQLASDLEASNIAKIAYTTKQSNMAQEIRRSAMDGYHQIGTTRMGKCASDSVVDPNCRVHGLQGLYIASSSIFRSSAAVPPTLSIVAFALRLAKHLTTVRGKD
nr:GMC family oxidoreductase [Phaeobacter sp. 22II1-1F12B]